MSKILVLDDDLDWLVFVSRLLALHGHDVRHMKRADHLIRAIKEFVPDLVITDIMMPGMSGSGVCQLIRSDIGPDLPILVCSSTRLKVKSDDPMMVHLPKEQAPEHLVDTVSDILHVGSE